MSEYDAQTKKRMLRYSEDSQGKRAKGNFSMCWDRYKFLCSLGCLPCKCVCKFCKCFIAKGPLCVACACFTTVLLLLLLSYLINCWYVRYLPSEHCYFAYCSLSVGVEDYSENAVCLKGAFTC